MLLDVPHLHDFRGAGEKRGRGEPSKRDREARDTSDTMTKRALTETKRTLLRMNRGERAEKEQESARWSREARPPVSVGPRETRGLPRPPLFNFENPVSPRDTSDNPPFI